MSEERENTQTKTRSTSKLTPEMEARKWKKGQPSPNPGGRPKKKPITDIYEELLADPQYRQQLMASVRQNSLSKNAAIFLKEMADRVEGKVTEKIEHSGLIETRELDDAELSERITQLERELGYASAIDEAGRAGITQARSANESKPE